MHKTNKIQWGLKNICQRVKKNYLINIYLEKNIMLILY